MVEAVPCSVDTCIKEGMEKYCPGLEYKNRLQCPAADLNDFNTFMGDCVTKCFG